MSPVDGLLLTSARSRSLYMGLFVANTVVQCTVTQRQADSRAVLCMREDKTLLGITPAITMRVSVLFSLRVCLQYMTAHCAAAGVLVAMPSPGALTSLKLYIYWTRSYCQSQPELQRVRVLIVRAR